MAKQNGPFLWEITIQGISFYKRCGIGCVRMKSNLTRERWLADPAFAGSRKSAANLAQASVLAAWYYQLIPQLKRSYPVYRQLVGVGHQMMTAGFSTEQVKKVLDFAVHRYLRNTEVAEARAAGIPLRSSFSASRSLKEISFAATTQTVTGPSHFSQVKSCGLQPSATEYHHTATVLSCLAISARGRPYKAALVEECDPLVATHDQPSLMGGPLHVPVCHFGTFNR
ncbi:hypothetical protein [Filimonas effusa]|uniref:Uncharacterized protein n=1 Tax=Filimonas effusa TaxID=2508721 RepID=A0A4Q1DBN7_9BACT|nr:hypothetical protein [Filimonas effusa]RXK86894.1 hypothetical protein ESB13_08920 [Filimonas effusa]